MPALHLARSLSARPVLRGCWVAVCGLLLGLCTPLAQAADLAALCDAPAPFDRLNAPLAQAPALPAQAHWLSRDLIQWPGEAAAADGSGWVVLTSHSGALVLQEGAPVAGADAVLPLTPATGALPAPLGQRFGFVAAGPVLQLPAVDAAQLRRLHQAQLVLARLDGQGRLLRATRVQAAGAFDDLFAQAFEETRLGVSLSWHSAGPTPATTAFALWAPSAQAVQLCLHSGPQQAARALHALALEPETGIWRLALGADLTGQYYRYLVTVYVPGLGLVRQRVTDPYAISLSADSRLAYIANLAAPALAPSGWQRHARPAPLHSATDMVIYELHVRDFSWHDRSVPAPARGKYAAFTQRQSSGMRHLRALAQAGLTDIHLLPIFDFATVPESRCDPQGSVTQDCYNWGYDPLHFNAPEGSYASDAQNGAVRIKELRRMVQALHAAGLRVGMDVVYNHTSASGQHPQSVLDRIVPGYYHRLNAQGEVERSTCCANTATEHRMMGKLMADSVLLWARHYAIDSFRFDLMGHQPREVMQAIQARLRAELGRSVQLLGEGWNFGEVANGARFVQASQLSLNSTGIGSFNDRLRDALRGGGASDAPPRLLAAKGYVNGAVNGEAQGAGAAALADQVRAGLAGSLRDYLLPSPSHGTAPVRLDALRYGDQPLGYASAPTEVVNYVENHDNHSLFDLNVFKLPQNASPTERVRSQLLALAITSFSQGVAYFHAGVDLLRSKSLDGNSYDSGDTINRLDWTYQHNGFGTALPPQAENPATFALMPALLANPRIPPRPVDIAQARDGFRDLLRIRASSRLFRLDSAQAVRERLHFMNTGPKQNPALIAARLEGQGLPGAGFAQLLYFVNVSPKAQRLTLPELAGQPYTLHPVHRAPGAGDPRPRQLARHDRGTGTFSIPAQTALVYVLPLRPAPKLGPRTAPVRL